MQPPSVCEFTSGDWNILTYTDKGYVNLLTGLDEETVRITARGLSNNTVDPWPERIREQAVYNTLGCYNGYAQWLDPMGNERRGSSYHNSATVNSNFSGIQLKIWKKGDPTTTTLELWPKPKDYDKLLSEKEYYYKTKKTSGDYEVRGNKIILDRWYWEFPVEKIEEVIDYTQPIKDDDSVIKEKKKKWIFW